MRKALLFIGLVLMLPVVMGVGLGPGLFSGGSGSVDLTVNADGSEDYNYNDLPTSGTYYMQRHQLIIPSDVERFTGVDVPWGYSRSCGGPSPAAETNTQDCTGGHYFNREGHGGSIVPVYPYMYSISDKKEYSWNKSNATENNMWYEQNMNVTPGEITVTPSGVTGTFTVGSYVIVTDKSVPTGGGVDYQDCFGIIRSWSGGDLVIWFQGCNREPQDGDTIYETDNSDPDSSLQDAEATWVSSTVSQTGTGFRTFFHSTDMSDMSTGWSFYGTNSAGDFEPIMTFSSQSNNNTGLKVNDEDGTPLGYPGVQLDGVLTVRGSDTAVSPFDQGSGGIAIRNDSGGNASIVNETATGSTVFHLPDGAGNRSTVASAPYVSTPKIGIVYSVEVQSTTVDTGTELCQALDAGMYCRNVADFGPHTSMVTPVNRSCSTAMTVGDYALVSCNSFAP